MQVKVKIEKNADKIKTEFAKQTERVLYAVGTQAVSDVVSYMSKPDFTGRDIVDTGRLRASISFLTPEIASGANGAEASKADTLQGAGEENAVLIGSNVEYADDVNNGAFKKPARKFMENSINPNKNKYQRTADKIFRGEL